MRSCNSGLGHSTSISPGDDRSSRHGCAGFALRHCQIRNPDPREITRHNRLGPHAIRIVAQVRQTLIRRGSKVLALGCMLHRNLSGPTHIDPTPATGVLPVSRSSKIAFTRLRSIPVMAKYSAQTDCASPFSSVSSANRCTSTKEALGISFHERGFCDTDSPSQQIQLCAAEATSGIHHLRTGEDRNLLVLQ